MEKIYIVQKMVVAKSIIDALKKEKDISPNDIYLDHDWKKANMPPTRKISKIGFKE